MKLQKDIFSFNKIGIGVVILCLALFNSSNAFSDTNYKPWAQTGMVSSEKPQELDNVGILEKNGDQIDLDLEFTDDTGKTVKLGEYFSKNKPVILSMVYFNCPSLCNLHLNGVTEALRQLNDEWTIGDKFEFLSITIDPKEDYKLAAAKKESYIQSYGREEAAKGWHFLTGSDDQIKKLATQVGFNYKWMPDVQEYAHASAAIIITPEGKISRYLHGVGFDPNTIRLSLVEASKGLIGDIIDKFVLYCFKYDPNKKTYAFYAYNFMKIGAALAAFTLFAFLLPGWRKMHKESQDEKRKS